LSEALEPAVTPDFGEVGDQFDFPFVMETATNSSSAAHGQGLVIHAFETGASYE
jgi:hypothetical protein